MTTTRHNIQIQISGHNLHPETLSIQDLTGYLLDIEAAILATADDDGIELPPEDMLSMSLVDIADNCVSVRLALALMLMPAVAAVTHAIHNGATPSLTDMANNRVARLVERVAKNRHTIRIPPMPEYNIEEAIIGPESVNEFQQEAPLLIHGQSIIYGRCIDVGGLRKPRATIVLAAGAQIKAYGSEEHIRQLGRLIYDDVRIDGIASWRMPDWLIESIDIKHIEPHPYISPVDAFRELRETSGRYWEDVNAKNFAHNLRYGKA